MPVTIIHNKTLYLDLIELQIGAETGYNKLNFGWKKSELYGNVSVIPFKQRETTTFSSQKHRRGI